MRQESRSQHEKCLALAPGLRAAGLIFAVFAFAVSLLPGQPAHAAPPGRSPSDAEAEVTPNDEPASLQDDGASFLLSPDSAVTPQDIDPGSQAELSSDANSVRRRGLEAPFVLQPRQPTAALAVPDPGDGTPRGGSPPPPRARETEKRKQNARESEPARVWPMPAESYTFTQAFGCVPQLGNLYFADPNCPPNAPVVHTGIDMAAPEGTPFYAAASGWVTLAGYDRPTPDANTRIIIQHDGKNDGYSTEYLHWVATFVAVGDYVHVGQLIGEVGNVGFSTGPHLHFSVIDLASGEHTDPVRWLPKDPASGSYPGRLPEATFRLPAGTTAGYPEGADPSPPDPPRREKVPKSPSQSAGTEGHRNDRRDHGKHEGKSKGENAGSDRGKGHKQRKDKNQAVNDQSDGGAKRQRGNEDSALKRERNRDGSATSNSEGGTSGNSGRKGQDTTEKSNRQDKRERRSDAADEASDSNQDRGETKRDRDNDSSTGRSGNDHGPTRDESGKSRRDDGERERKQQSDPSAEGNTSANNDDAERSRHGRKAKDERY